MRILSVKKHERSVTTGSASDTGSQPRRGARHSALALNRASLRGLTASLRRQRAWWANQKRRTKAVVATSFVAFGTLIGCIANGLTVWDRLWHKDHPTKPEASSTSAVMPLPTCFTCTTGKTFPEQVSPTSIGARTFRNPLAFGGEGKRVTARQHVQVVCRFQQLDAPASVQPGWWYLIASPPWNRQYYSPANSYLNGDPLKGPYLTNVNSGIPVC